MLLSHVQRPCAETARCAQPLDAQSALLLAQFLGRGPLDPGEYFCSSGVLRFCKDSPGWRVITQLRKPLVSRGDGLDLTFGFIFVPSISCR